MQRRGSRTASRRGTRIAKGPSRPTDHPKEAGRALAAPAGILAAGGRGTRVGGSALKQFLKIGDKPLLEWSLESLVTAGCDPVIVVLPEDSIEAATEVLGDAAGMVIAGGDTRQASVRNGLREVSTETVIVHDGARPFADLNSFRSVIAAIEEFDGAAVALPLHETLKRMDGSVETLPRDGLWKAQTPQAFRTGILKKCHDRADAESFVATDDLQLLERYGFSVTLVEGSPINIKVTYPEDLVLAEAIARSRA